MKRAGLFALAFVLMLGVAVASMVDFTGRRSDREEVARSVTARSDSDPPAIAPSGLVIPVVGARWREVRDSWGEARGDGSRGHAGTDIMAPGGTPVVTAAAGTVEKLFDSEAGGHTVYIRSPDGRWSYYYAHLAAYVPGIAEGQTLPAGRLIGFVGDTGNAGTGNYHLHFGISRMRPDERWYQGEPVNPYPLLAGDAARR